LFVNNWHFKHIFESVSRYVTVVEISYSSLVSCQLCWQILCCVIFH